MADVFISYARKDKDFVRKLHESLLANGRETWVDWAGIQPTAEWWKEICTAIENANTFAFIISPAALASDYCGREIEHAGANNKRILGLAYCPVPDKDIPEPLASRQWLDFLDPETFQSTFEQLLAALDTDLEWVKLHTRLLTRAKEWDFNKREPDYLLRGRDLEEAEQALVQAGSRKEPQPTPLQTEYILASREEVARASEEARRKEQSILRQRRIIGWTTAALLVILALAGVATAEAYYSSKNEKKALEQEKAANQSAKDARDAKNFAEHRRAVAQKGIDIRRTAISGGRADVDYLVTAGNVDSKLKFACLEKRDLGYRGGPGGAHEMFNYTLGPVLTDSDTGLALHDVSFVTYRILSDSPSWAYLQSAGPPRYRTVFTTSSDIRKRWIALVEYRSADHPPTIAVFGESEKR